MIDADTGLLQITPSSTEGTSTCGIRLYSNPSVWIYFEYYPVSVEITSVDSCGAASTTDTIQDETLLVGYTTVLTRTLNTYQYSDHTACSSFTSEIDSTANFITYDSSSNEITISPTSIDVLGNEVVYVMVRDENDFAVDYYEINVIVTDCDSVGAVS